MAPRTTSKQPSPLPIILGAFAALLVVGGAVAAVALWRTTPTVGGRAPIESPLRTAPTNPSLLVTPPPAEPVAPATASFVLENRVAGYKSSFYLLGFVTNTSPFTIDKPKLTAVLVDQSGKEVATRDGYAHSEALAPKATAPFKLLVSDPPAHARYSIEIVARKASYVPEQASDLRLEILEQPHATFGNSWQVSGKVFNDGKQGARFVKIDVLAFDDKNKLIGLDYTYVDGERLAAGASGRFRALPLYQSTPHHFRFDVSGKPDK